MRRVRLLILAVMSIAVGCSFDNDRWVFDPFGIAYKDKSYLPPGHPDRWQTDLHEQLERGDGFHWDKEKRK